jgi:hypothetical protein
MEYDLSHITSLKSLQKEQQLIRQRIKHRENELRLKMYEIPGELAAAGANTLIPRILRGKITDAALSGGKKIINKFFEPENKGPQSLIKHGVNKGGNVISLIAKGIKLLKGRK